MEYNASTSDIAESQRWLINNGFFNDMHKDNLYLFGSLLHKGVEAVELTVDVENKKIKYFVFCNNKLLKKIKTYNKLRDSNSLFSLWRLSRLLKKEGNLEFKNVLRHFVRSYCGDKWSVSLEIKRKDQYDDKGYEQ